MAENNALWEDLNDLLVGFQEQKDQIFESFQILVTAVISGSITSEKEIRNLIDSLGDFCDEARFFVLYQDLFRYIHMNRSEMIGEYKHLFHIQL